MEPKLVLQGLQMGRRQGAVLSVLGASSPPDFSSVGKKGGKNVLCTCWLLSSCLCSPCQCMDPGNHLCPPQLCLHIWSYSHLVSQLQSLKKGF